MFGRSQIYFMSKLKKYLIVTTASLLAVSGLFYIVNNYDSDYLNRGLADIFSIKKRLPFKRGAPKVHVFKLLTLLRIAVVLAVPVTAVPVQAVPLIMTRLRTAPLLVVPVLDV